MKSLWCWELYFVHYSHREVLAMDGYFYLCPMMTKLWPHINFNLFYFVSRCSFMCPCTHTICLIFKRYINADVDYKIEVSVLICFSVMLITYTHTQRLSVKSAIFGFRGPRSLLIQSKSPFLKFDPKTILSLPYLCKRL